MRGPNMQARNMRRRLLAAAATAALTLAACGGDDDAPESRDEIADELVAAMEEGLDDTGGAATIDESCVRDRINGLSDDDVATIADSWDSPDVPEDLSADGAEALAGLIECMDVDLSDITLPDVTMPDMPDISMPDITMPNP